MSDRTREAGFTLIELLVAVAIMGIVVGGLATALTIGLKTTTATATTLVDAGDSQALSYRLMTDVKAAVALGTTGGPTCAPPAPTPPQLLARTRILWTQSADEVAAYFVDKVAADPGSSARSELRRLSCDAAGTPKPGPTQGVVLARWPGTSENPEVSCDDRPRFGAQTTLQDTVVAGDPSVKLVDASGFPGSGPYPIVVDGETMTVTQVSGATLTVTRADPQAHDLGRAVTYAGCGAAARLTADLLASDTTLTVTDAVGFPVSGPPYKLVVGAETMRVTGGFGTPTLTVARPSGVPQAAQTPVGWTPDLVTLVVPRGDATGAPGAPPFRLSISRRAT